MSNRERADPCGGVLKSTGGGGGRPLSMRNVGSSVVVRAVESKNGGFLLLLPEPPVNGLLQEIPYPLRTTVLPVPKTSKAIPKRGSQSRLYGYMSPRPTLLPAIVASGEAPTNLPVTGSKFDCRSATSTGGEKYS